MVVYTYYQTFINIPSDVIQKIDIIIISSIHFDSPTKSMHLNNSVPDSKKFDILWKNCVNWSQHDKKVYVMIGGAGKAYEVLFSEYEFYFEKLKGFLLDRPYITGIVLDIEETVSVSRIQDFIRDLLKIRHFEICAAPCQFCLTPPCPGMGGFEYKKISKMIDVFLVQAYERFSVEVKSDIVKTWPEVKIVMGCLVNTIPTDKLKGLYDELHDICLWELGETGGIDWVKSLEKSIVKKIFNIINKTLLFFKNT